MRALISLLIGLSLAGCAADVKPWQKRRLASESMRTDGGNSLKSAFEEHIFISKEGAKGGNGVSGGGCGCK